MRRGSRMLGGSVESLKCLVGFASASLVYRESKGHGRSGI